MAANDNHSANPVDSQIPADNASTPREENPRFRLMIIGTLVTALIFIIIVLVIQIMEFQFYRAPQSIWPGAGGATVSPASAVPPVPASVSPIAVPTTTPPQEPAETRAVLQPAVSNEPAPAVPTMSTNYPAETTALPIISTSEVSSTAAPPTTAPSATPSVTPTTTSVPTVAIPSPAPVAPPATSSPSTASVPAPVSATTPASTPATGTESDAKATPAEPSGTAP